MRSKLFVPCSRPEFFAKALRSEADALSFDLEDSVPVAGKAVARERLAALLRSDGARHSTKRLIVRVNAVSTPDFEHDMDALAGLRVDLVNVPKPVAAEDVSTAAQACERRWPSPPELLLTIENACALMSAAELAAAHPLVAGLQVGLNDLFDGMDVDRADLRAVHAALWSIRVAAAVGECFAYDGAWPDLADEQGFREEAMMARRLGFLGKSCVHPNQVAIANAVFDRRDEVAEARRLIAAADEAEAAGLGAFTFEGRMVDAPAVARARALLRGAGA